MVIIIIIIGSSYQPSDLEDRQGGIHIPLWPSLRHNKKDKHLECMNKFRLSRSLYSLLGMDTANAHAVEKLLEI